MSWVHVDLLESPMLIMPLNFFQSTHNELGLDENAPSPKNNLW